MPPSRLYPFFLLTAVEFMPSQLFILWVPSSNLPRGAARHRTSPCHHAGEPAVPGRRTTPSSGRDRSSEDLQRGMLYVQQLDAALVGNCASWIIPHDSRADAGTAAGPVELLPQPGQHVAEAAQSRKMARLLASDIGRSTPRPTCGWLLVVVPHRAGGAEHSHSHRRKCW